MKRVPPGGKAEPQQGKEGSEARGQRVVRQRWHGEGLRVLLQSTRAAPQREETRIADETKTNSVLWRVSFFFHEAGGCFCERGGGGGGVQASVSRVCGGAGRSNARGQTMQIDHAASCTCRNGSVEERRGGGGSSGAREWPGAKTTARSEGVGTGMHRGGASTQTGREGPGHTLKQLLRGSQAGRSKPKQRP